MANLLIVIPILFLSVVFDARVRTYGNVSKQWRGEKELGHHQSGCSTCPLFARSKVDIRTPTKRPSLCLYLFHQRYHHNRLNQSLIRINGNMTDLHSLVCKHFEKEILKYQHLLFFMAKLAYEPDKYANTKIGNILSSSCLDK